MIILRICKDCDYCIFIGNRCIDNAFCLSRPIIHHNPVMGSEKMLKSCRTKNDDGDCCEFTPRRAWWRKIFGGKRRI